MGGLIRVDGNIYGLTVAHSYSNHLDSIPLEHCALSDSSQMEDTDSDNSDSGELFFNGFECHRIQYSGYPNQGRAMPTWKVTRTELRKLF